MYVCIESYIPSVSRLCPYHTTRKHEFEYRSSIISSHYKSETLRNRAPRNTGRECIGGSADCIAIRTAPTTHRVGSNFPSLCSHSLDWRWTKRRESTQILCFTLAICAQKSYCKCGKTSPVLSSPLAYDRRHAQVTPGVWSGYVRKKSNFGCLSMAFPRFQSI